jgi:Domain of unknown function (DUF4835)
MKKILLLILMIPVLNFAQELSCTVTVNTDNILSSDKDKLSGFQQMISDYLNKTDFQASDGIPLTGPKIICSMTIMILTISSDVNFTAQVVVTSQRPIYKTSDNSLMLAINDNNWSFSYTKGQTLYANQNTYDPIRSFLDYYADIIIGFDMDSWTQLGGTPYFNKAFNVANLAVGGGASGWTSSSNSYSRKGLVEDLLSDKYRPFRESLYDYYYGIDVYSVNRTVGQENIVKLINTLDQLRDKIDLNGPLMKVFFDAKSGELSEKLKSYQDKEIVTELKRIDPAHIAKYNTILEAD